MKIANGPYKVYAVHQGDDDRSFGKAKWFFSNREDAERVAYKRGWYGGNAPITERWAISVSDDVLGFTDTYLLDSVSGLAPAAIEVGITPDMEKDIWNKAVEKLTPTERQLFGVSIKE